LGYLVRKNDLNDTDPLADRDNRIIEVRLTLDPLAVADLRHQIFRQVYVRIAP
jgi:HlyD family secretion protein